MGSLPSCFRILVRTFGVWVKTASSWILEAYVISTGESKAESRGESRNQIFWCGSVWKFSGIWVRLVAVFEYARGAGMTKSEYLRRRLAECDADPRRRRPPRPRVLPREVREALLPLARLGNNLNQLARWENIRQEPAESFRVLSAIRELSDELAGVRRAVLQAPVAAGQLPDEE